MSEPDGTNVRQREAVTSFAGAHRWASNFFPALVELDGVLFPAVKNAYQASKRPRKEWEQFVRCSAWQAKRLNTGIPRRVDCEEVMLNLLRQKYRWPELKRFLLETRGRFLMEGNTWHDNFWGSCSCLHLCGSVTKLNKLGLLTMQVREELWTSEMTISP